MKKTLLQFILLIVFLTSCGPTLSRSIATSTASPLPEGTSTNTSSAAIIPAPTITPAVEPTAAPTLLPNIREAHLTGIDIIDETSGWAWAVDQADVTYWLHTEDGGLTWENITPEKNVSHSFSSFVLDAQIAWVVLADGELTRTLDGGQTWDVIQPNLRDQLDWPYADWYWLRFTDASHGWIQGVMTAAGARQYFYETQDGGSTWEPANFETLPEPYRQENSRNEIAFWINTDVIYYDLERFVIVPALDEQEGKFEMFLSIDWGASWKTVELPSEFLTSSLESYEKISQPVFFDLQNGVLSVSIWNEDVHASQVLIYGTSNGGLTWSLLGGPTTLKDTIIERGSEVLFLSPRDAVLLCGTNLCVTHDSGNSWQTFAFGIPIDKERAFLQLDFINPDMGWFLLSAYDDQYVGYSRLLKTNDGGVTWTELSPVIHP